MMRTTFVLLTALIAASAADRDGATIYKRDCALCHGNSTATRAPSPEAMRRMTVEHIVKALETGLMKEQGAKLPATEKKIIAAYLAAREPLGESAAASNACKPASFGPGPGDWNGWSPGFTNARFSDSRSAKFTAADLPRLKLKWTFAFPNTAVSNGQPSVVGGRVFVASANSYVYSLDASTGCEYWSFKTDSSVRAAITIAPAAGSTPALAFFGDQRANAYAVDAATGKLIWKRRMDDHARAKIVGSPVYHAGRLYVPITAGEEGPAMSPGYECCSGRGALLAVDARTGEQIWKTYTIVEEPKPTTKSSAGTQMWGPSGASIWSAPTIDTEKQIIYAATGDNFSDPATKTSDAIMAFDMKTGKVLWTTQLTENDVYNMACGGRGGPSCPEKPGPDFDIGASPILAKVGNRRMLLVSQKSGFVHGIDPDQGGKLMWSTQLGRGGTLGGLQWGSAFDGRLLFGALSDIKFLPREPNSNRRNPDPNAGGGIHGVDPLTGRKVWSAKPPDCTGRQACSPAQSAAVSAIAGAVISGSLDARIRAYSTEDGRVLWEFDAAREFTSVNGVPAKGGSMDGPGPAIANGMMFVPAGYGLWGGLSGNVLLAFSIDGK